MLWMLMALGEAVIKFWIIRESFSDEFNSTSKITHLCCPYRQLFVIFQSMEKGFILFRRRCRQTWFGRLRAPLASDHT